MNERVSFFGNKKKKTHFGYMCFELGADNLGFIPFATSIACWPSLFLGPTGRTGQYSLHRQQSVEIANVASDGAILNHTFGRFVL